MTNKQFAIECENLERERENLKDIPRVMRVEHVERDNREHMRVGSLTPHYRDWTNADVMTPFGEIHVRLSGFHCQRRSYPHLIALAMEMAWQNFCNTDTFAVNR